MGQLGRGEDEAALFANMKALAMKVFEIANGYRPASGGRRSGFSDSHTCRDGAV